MRNQNVMLVEEELDKKRLDKLDNYYKKSIQKLQSQFVMELFQGRVPKECIKEICIDYDMNLEASCYVAVAFRVDDSNIEETSLMERFKEVSFNGFKIYSVVQHDVMMAILLLEDEKYLNRAVWEVDQICKAVEAERKFHLTAGIGTMVETLLDLSKSWQEACEAVAYRLFRGQGQAICISDVWSMIDEDFVMDNQKLSKLLKDIKLGETQELISDVDALVGQFRSRKIALSKYWISMTEVIVELLKLARTYRVNLDLLLGEKFDIYKEVRRFASLEELGEWMSTLCLGIRTAIRGEKKDSAKLLVDSAKQFIHENYSDSALSVEVLCGYLNVSATYFSTIFKRETGKSFVTYLTDVRMEAARELLNNTEDKTYVISAKVGYPEPNYFSYVFKKQYGIAPSKYRAGKMQESE